MLYFYLVMAHSLVRWLVLVAAIVALVGARVASGRDASGWGSKAGLVYSVVLDVQVLLGLIMWLWKSAWRWHAFFAFIHPGTMILAMLVAHLGQRLQKRGKPAAGFWLYLASLVLVIAAIPWRS
ncbi:MAG: hypothetical protein AB2385_11375 [Symbiobacterium sp.]|uniref:hypothetical protein n=1 Tax=Symbiobacterium sp. TaxID=1971213 RepID=UPI0034641A0A